MSGHLSALSLPTSHCYGDACDCHCYCFLTSLISPTLISLISQKAVALHRSLQIFYFFLILIPRIFHSFLILIHQTLISHSFLKCSHRHNTMISKLFHST